MMVSIEQEIEVWRTDVLRKKSMPVTEVLWTSETPSRKVAVHGRSAMEQDCMVVSVEGEKDCVWMYPTGYLDPIGRDIFAGKTPEDAVRLKGDIIHAKEPKA